MSWFKVDDHMASHPAVMRVGDEALGYWMRLGCWLAQFPEQGDFVPDVIVDMMLRGSKGRRNRRKVDALVQAGMLRRIDGGYRLYDGLDICGSHLQIPAWQVEVPTGRRPTITPNLRAEVILRDGYVCQLCAHPVDPTDVHLDHILPFSKGGQTIAGNLQVTHSVCNMRKGARV